MKRSGKIKAKNDYLVHALLSDRDYKVTSDGRVLTRVARTGKVFLDPAKIREAGRKDSQGYWTLHYGGKNVSRARAVYAKFVGPLSDDLVINHKNGNRSDDHPSNLELVSQAANNLHAFRTLKRKPVYGNVRLSFDIADKIRGIKKLGYTHKQICVMYDISKGHVSEIVNNKIWVRPPATY